MHTTVAAAAVTVSHVGYQYDVSALFGAAPPTHPSYDRDGTITGVPVDLFNRKLQVRIALRPPSAPQCSMACCNCPVRDAGVETLLSWLRQPAHHSPADGGAQL